MDISTLDHSMPATRRKSKGLIRRCERCCTSVVTRLPLVFVYGITTWATYVEFILCLNWTETTWAGYPCLMLGLLLYGLLNWSYTVAVLTDPGSPLSSPISSGAPGHKYSHLPTHEPARDSDVTSLTVKSTGETRFCKKCRTKKPDRAHHCSTCGRCVLKMDHHCPWLATCVGLRNYKPFLLFCLYVTLFCWVCFGVSSTSVWDEIMDEALARDGELFSVNVVLLAVLSGIFGLVLAGFTGWHISLAVRNQTTIECLEKTRYLSPIRRTMNRALNTFASNGEDANLVYKYGQQLTEIHANSLPGITSLEEEEERVLPTVDTSGHLTATEALRMNYSDMERQREQERYENYLDEKDSENLPNAFDMGWRRNLIELFGESPLLWFLPICNTVVDGWHWHPNPKWLAARETLRLKREGHWRAQERREEAAGWGHSSHLYSTSIGDDDNGRHYLSTTNGIASVPTGRRSPGKANQVLGRTSNQFADDACSGSEPFETDLQMQTLHIDHQNEDSSSLDGLYDREEFLERESLDESNANTVHNHRGVILRSQSEDSWRDWD